MAMHHSVSNESSVLFNLRQLMELEEARVQSEAEAARAAELASREREAAARARTEREAAQAERARIEELRRVELDARRIEQEREAALLRVRLEAEARERAEFSRLALERDQLALQQARVSQRAGRPGAVTIALMAVAAAVIGAAAIYAANARTQLLATADRDRPPVSVSLFAHQARELAALRNQIAAMTAPRPAEVQPAPASKPPSTATPKPRPAKHLASTSLKPSKHQQGSIDIDLDSDDPIGEL
jgi:colicin import membrane protein